MKRWIGLGWVLCTWALALDQLGFRGSLGVTSTSDYLKNQYNVSVDPTGTGLSYGLGLGYRFSSGFLFELDFISSSNDFNDTTLNNACSGSACVYTACTNDGSTNPPTTTCTGTNMAAPATTTGTTVDLSGSTLTAGSATASAPTTTSSTSGTVTTTTTVIDYTGTSSSQTGADSGYLAVSSLMINAIYQFAPANRLNPYVGYGMGYAQSDGGIGILTSPVNTTVETSTITQTDAQTNSTSTTSATVYLSSINADQASQTLTSSVSAPAQQWVFGAEIRFDIHNTVDVRVVKRFITVPDVTTLVDSGTPYPTIGVVTTCNGVTTNTVNQISASTTTFEIGLLYYA